MYAGLAGARSVVSVDSSRKAIEACNRNAELNGLQQHASSCSDVFDFLKHQSEQQFDLIVLDPPAFAKHLSSVENAMIGYRNLNTEGFRRIKSGGILFTFSCSQVMDKLLFRKVVFRRLYRRAERSASCINSVRDPITRSMSTIRKVST